jgi:hypothetical protein
MADHLSLQLASDIRALVEKPALSEADLTRWLDEASVLRRKLSAIYESLDDQIPEELEHYLSDPDIRLTDKEYSERQTAFILRIIADLESGRYNSDSVAARLRRRADIGYH